MGHSSGRIKARLGALLATLALLMTIVPVGTVLAAPAAISLEQCRNGSAASPQNCTGSAWQNGNVGASQGHLVEGYSIPYRALITNAPTGQSITVVLGYDIKHSGAHALDYLTHFNRLTPHGVFGHAAESVVPTSGVSGLSATTSTFGIPAPSSTGSPVSGQPTASFTALPAGERVMTLFGGTITAMSYVSQGSLTASQAETQISVTFTLDSANAVLSWGGHIARGDEWNGASASAISGSPYHMRLKSWNLGNVGNQDRSLSAGAVINPPKLIVIKEVINDNGGTAVASDFTINVSGGGTPSSFAGSTTGTTVLFADNATYAVTETPPTGYTVSYSADCTGTITTDQTKTCTVTNNDNPNQPAIGTTMRWVLHDSATVTGLRPGALNAASATIEFKLYSDAACGTQVGSTESRPVALNAAGTEATASTVNGVAVSATGTYYWRAFYSGDTNNLPASTACGTEVTTISTTGT